MRMTNRTTIQLPELNHFNRASDDTPAHLPEGKDAIPGVWSVEVLLRASSDFFPTFTARFATREEAERVAAGIHKTLASVPSRDRRVSVCFLPAALAH